MASRDCLRRFALRVVSPYPTWSRFRENMCSAQRAESERTRSIARGALRSMDVVVPVPLHRDREKERRYNQAELLSRPLAKLLRLPHRGVLLVRKRPRPAKHLLTLRKRWAAVRGEFETCPGSQVDNQRVLLLDDVMTTGATLDACSKALRDAGAKSVVALTVARAAHNPLPAAGES
jgi:ComF family protein